MQHLTKLLLQEHNPSEVDSTPSDDSDFLREVVEDLSFLRHIHRNPEGNFLAANKVLDVLNEYTDYAFVQGPYRNVVAGWGRGVAGRHVIGGHYDGPPNSPGADDNGSAIASLCLLAKKLSKSKPSNVVLVAFNGEEEGFLGSENFASQADAKSAVILEMVGYFTDEENTQRMPEGLPQFSVGDFLAIVGNKDSNGLGKSMIDIAQKIDLKLPLKSLQIPFGLENKLLGLEHVKRSDHFPFWERGIPAVMLTDTAEFRNKHYHGATDTPDTLNYPAMAKVVSLLESYVLSISN